MQQNEAYQKSFIFHHSTLIRKLTGVELIQTAFSRQLIGVGEYDEINSLKTDSSIIRKLLSIIHRRYYGNPDVFKNFLTVMEDVSDLENGILDYVIDGLRETIKNPPDFPSSGSLLGEFERARLLLNEATIVATLDVNGLLPDLISEGVVNMLEAESIEIENTFERRGAKLVNMIKNKGSEVFQRFIGVLRDSETYEQLADRLSRPEEEINGGAKWDDKKYVEKVLKDGRVPPVPHNSVRRVELVKSIRRELRKMKDTDSWVVVHGLPGFGKTVLAADCVSQASLLRDVFPGGVFWLSIGKMRDSSGDVNMDALLEKVQNFILRMDKDKYRPLNLESATDYLQTVMSIQHPRSLLILDDVWEPESAQAFSVRCRTLVTTRNFDIAEGVATNNVYKVSVTEGLTQDEGLALISKYTGVPIADLPPEAIQIIKLSYGSPIVLDIIGASLPKSKGRWSVAVDRLKTQHPGGLKAGTSPYLRTRRPSEQKRGTKTTLNTSILMTEESLLEEIRTYFQWLVVFREDTIIRPDTLATIWDMNKYDAVDIVEELRTWSLVKQAHIQSDDINDEDDLASYTIHDMIMDYLRDRVDQDTQKHYHEQLVERYREKCDGDFSSLEPDGYIHKNLLSHIDLVGGMTELIAALLSNLRWLAACVRYWDCNSLLAAYKKYKTVIPEKDLPVVNEFQLFLSSNLDVLSSRPSLSDVVQLALTTLHSDTLVHQARQEIEKDNDTMYLVWNNRLSAKRPEATLKLQPHSNDIRYCQYYDQGTKVVSCSNDVVKLWTASTGEVLETFSKHTNTVTHCTISEDGTLLVDSSDDSTCNVWDVNQHSLILKFEEHCDGVQCCELSPDNKLVVSVDINSFALVWSCDRSNLGAVIGKWNHADCGLTSCTFLKSGKEVVVANQDGLVMMYSIQGNSLMTFPLNPSVLTFSQSGVVELASSRGPSRSSSSSTGGSGFTVNSCVISRDGKMLAAGAADCTARVWSTETSQQLYSFPHSSQVLSVDFSPNSKLLLTGCVSGIIQVWSLENQCPILDLPLHYDWVMCSKFSPSGSHILTSSFGIVKVIPLEKGKQNWKLYKRRFSVQFRMTLERKYTPTIVCYDTKSKSLEVCEGLNASPVTIIDTKKKLKPRSWSISPDATLVAVGYDEGALQVFDVNGTLQWKRDDAHNGEIPHCYFSPDGSKIVTCGDCHQVWSVETSDKLSWQPDCQEFYIQPCVFYNDSKRLASAKKPGKILVWRITDGEELFYCDDINGEEMSILCVNINTDNTRLIASTVQGTVAVWNAETGQTVFTGSYSGSSGNLQARFCSLDRQGILAAVGHDDCTMKIYNIQSGEEITCPNSFSGSWMISTQFSPDDHQIVTLSNSIQWWSRDGKLLKQFILKSIFGKFLYFSPDFQTFVTIDNTGLLYVLSVL